MVLVSGDLRVARAVEELGEDPTSSEIWRAAGALVRGINGDIVLYAEVELAFAGMAQFEAGPGFLLMAAFNRLVHVRENVQN